MSNSRDCTTSDDSLKQAKESIAELEELVRILCRRLSMRAESLQEILPKFYRAEEIPDRNVKDESPVDIVLTARDAYEFLVPCLESVFANTDVPFRLFLNDDASGDARVPEYLRSLRERVPGAVRVFFQKESLGFPDAVNLLLAETANDVILLNSDTVMPPGWASRLLWPIRHSGLKVASSAPFTTSTMMGSFPYARMDNELLPGLDVESTDRIFQFVKPTSEWRFPWSPGFCLALSRKALDEVGSLDAETFRPGYGEDADWGHRATQYGYHHLLAANLFVYHKHGVSFKRVSSSARDALLAKHLAVLTQRYPGCVDQIHDFNDNPDFLAFSSFLLFLVGCASGGGLSVCFVPYGNMAPVADDTVAPTMCIARDSATGEYRLRFSYRTYHASFTSPNLNWALKALYRVKIVSIAVDLFPPGDEEKVRQAVVRMGKHFSIAPTGEDRSEIHET